MGMAPGFAGDEAARRAERDGGFEAAVEVVGIVEAKLGAECSRELEAEEWSS